MSKYITKIGHNKCGSSDALAIYENKDGTVSGFCFSCNRFEENPYGDPKQAKDIPHTAIKKSKEEIQQQFNEIESCGTVDLPSRKIRADTLSEFGVRVGLSQEDGTTPTVVFFPYTDETGKVVRYKCRLVGQKRMWSTSLSNEVMPFAWSNAISSTAKTLVITEGEFDAIAGRRIVELAGKHEYRDLYPAFVSVPNGAASASRDLARVASIIKKRFSDIKFMFDDDEAGREAVKQCMKIFPNATSITLPCKDANECLIKGKLKEAHAAIVWRADKPKNTRLVHGTELRDLAKKRPEFGIPWFCEGLTKLTRGIRRGETYYIGAGVKMGKSELVNEIAADLIDTHNLPVFLAKPEESTVKTYQMLVGKVAGKIFHDPNIPFDEEAFDKAEKRIGDKAIIVDSYQFVNWDTLKDDIRYVVHNEGVHDVIIDPITCFTNQMNSAEANEFLISMAAEGAAMAKDLDFTMYLFCHLKAPDGIPHERGGQVLSTQFAGSRGMMRSCHMMLGLEGNKDPELDIMTRNTRKLKLLEDRTFGETGIVQLYWDPKTGRFNEMKL